MKKQWALESTDTGVDFAITHLPCRIGRSKENDLMIANLGLSRFHARLAYDISGKLRISDESSTNGTFVNRQRVDSYCLLHEDDIIHFGSAEFRLRTRHAEEDDLPFDLKHTQVMPGLMTLSDHFSPGEMEFEDLILGNGLSGAAQPIVDARTRRIIAYEFLGRANHPTLPKSPLELFSLAEAMDRAVDLSVAFREFGFRKMAPCIAEQSVFINTHPKEIFSPVFISSLEAIRHRFPNLDIVVEIHESAVVDIARMLEFTRQLATLGIRFAFDDFGAGQARLLELAEVPAHYVKFDMSLIRGLPRANERKRQLVQDLVKMVYAAGAASLAEGVETEEEASICIDMGFEFIQGYLTGRPIPAESLSADPVQPGQADKK